MKILKDIRSAFGLTQYDLSVLIEKPQNYISALERGARRIKPAERAKILEHIHGLIERDGRMPFIELEMGVAMALMDTGVLIRPSSAIDILPEHFVIPYGDSYLFCVGDVGSHHVCGVIARKIEYVVLNAPYTTKTDTQPPATLPNKVQTNGGDLVLNPNADLPDSFFDNVLSDTNANLPDKVQTNGGDLPDSFLNKLDPNADLPDSFLNKLDPNADLPDSFFDDLLSEDV